MTQVTTKQGPPNLAIDFRDLYASFQTSNPGFTSKAPKRSNKCPRKQPQIQVLPILQLLNQPLVRRTSKGNQNLVLRGYSPNFKEVSSCRYHPKGKRLFNLKRDPNKYVPRTFPASVPPIRLSYQLVTLHQCPRTSVPSPVTPHQCPAPVPPQQFPCTSAPVPMPLYQCPRTSAPAPAPRTFCCFSKGSTALQFFNGISVFGVKC